MSEKVLVFGNQKSGTTAIAALLARSTQSTCTLDIPPIWENEINLHLGKVSMEDLVRKHPEYFEKRVIKEPCLTFLQPAIRAIFPNSHQVFVVRHPAENIRSILDRLETPGSLAHDINLDDYSRYGAWKDVLDGELIGISGEHFVERLARRWVMAAEMFLANSSEMTLIRYETFLEEKVVAITNLAKSLGMDAVDSIEKLKDQQFQPRGTNRGKNWLSFFGRINLGRIEKVTGPFLHHFNYEM